MHVKKGDKVIVLSGKDKGSKGTILEAFPKTGLVLVEGVNMVKRHQKARGRGKSKGEIIDKPMPINASNVKKA